MSRRKLTHEEFVSKSEATHGTLYSYPELYQGSTTPIKIVCTKHGVFLQTPKNHLFGQGCPECGNLRKAAKLQGIPLELYSEAKGSGLRFCKVHGFQSLSKYRTYEYLTSCIECHAQGKKDLEAKLRLQVLSHYSPGLRCVICGDPHYRFLALDHINGGGNEHRRSSGCQYTIFKDIIQQGFPDKYRVLCHNCNLKYGLRDTSRTGGPRKPEAELLQTSKAISDRAYSIAHRETILKDHKRRYQLVKTEVLSHYGGLCACCGIADFDVLSIDHIYGGGEKHRKELKGFGHCFCYGWLKKQGYPTEYQVLCLNCNMAKGFYGHCPHENELGFMLEKVS